MRYPMQYCILGAQSGDDGGAFRVPFENRYLHVIASHGGGWEHVSVSLEKRNPNWREMCFIKNLFWDKEEAVMQLHPPESQYINNHPFCLHLWKPLFDEIPLPPNYMVGFKSLNISEE